jgi:hypothetical protein
VELGLLGLRVAFEEAGGDEHGRQHRRVVVAEMRVHVGDLVGGALPAAGVSGHQPGDEIEDQPGVVHGCMVPKGAEHASQPCRPGTAATDTRDRQ